MYFGSFLGYFFEQADLVKIVLPPTREPHSGGSGGSEKQTFCITFLHLFLEPLVVKNFAGFGEDFEVIL